MAPQSVGFVVPVTDANLLTDLFGCGSPGGSVLVPIGSLCSGELAGGWSTQELGQDHSCHILLYLTTKLAGVRTSLTAIHFFKAAMKRNLSPAYVKEDLVQLGVC